MPDSQSRALVMETGQLLMSTASDIEPFDVPRLKQAAYLKIQTKGWEFFASLMWIDLNHRVKPLGDVKVGQAISMDTNP